jgi:hypothetical protein
MVLWRTRTGGAMACEEWGGGGQRLGVVCVVGGLTQLPTCGWGFELGDVSAAAGRWWQRMTAGMVLLVACWRG